MFHDNPKRRRKYDNDTNILQLIWKKDAFWCLSQKNRNRVNVVKILCLIILPKSFIADKQHHICFGFTSHDDKSQNDRRLRQRKDQVRTHEDWLSLSCLKWFCRTLEQRRTGAYNSQKENSDKNWISPCSPGVRSSRALIRTRLSLLES